MYLYNIAGVDILAYLSLRDTATSMIYKLGIDNGKVFLERIDNSNYQSFVCLRDENTSKIYKLSVSNSKLRMEEIITPTYSTSLHFLDETTGIIYELKVIDERLRFETKEVDATRDIKEVSLLDYWTPILRNLKDFKEIANAEEPELTYLLEAISRTLANTFIETADEYGIKRFEKLMGIYPEDGDTLETRRFRLQVKWNSEVPYTLETLITQIESVCGNGGYNVVLDEQHYILTVKLALSNEKNIETIEKLLDRVVPANLITVVTIFNTHSVVGNYTHEHLSAYTQLNVKEDPLE